MAAKEKEFKEVAPQAKSINEIDNLENTFKRLEINTVFSLESEQYA